MEEHFNKAIEIIVPWLLSHGIRIIVILVSAFIFHKILQKIIVKMVAIAVTRDKEMSEIAEKKREDTLNSVFLTTLKIVVITLVSLMVLKELGLDIGPLLAGAGIVGLALGFGGQYLIRDVISGLFIILENQYRVGDIVNLDGTGGLVENITLRMTTLRDLDGTVHHIQHGGIAKVSNLSKGFHRMNMNIGVSYSCKLNHVIEVINRVGKALAEDPAWKDIIISAPKFERVDAFSASSIDLKVLADIVPPSKWAVGGEFRKRLKEEFDKEGIEIPFQQVVVHNG